MFLNDIEDIFIDNELSGINVDMFKLFLISYADDIVIFANSKEQLQLNVDALYEYCQRWKMIVNINKTKVMVFRKSGRLAALTQLYYNNGELEVVGKCTYLGIVFSTGGSFSDSQNALSGPALKAITNISVRHRLDLFDKLISPILNYAKQVWGFIQGSSIERVHLQFCKRLLGVKRTIQNEFVFGELGRYTFHLFCSRYITIVKYWVNILQFSPSCYNWKIVRMVLAGN